MLHTQTIFECEKLRLSNGWADADGLVLNVEWNSRALPFRVPEGVGRQLTMDLPRGANLSRSL